MTVDPEASVLSYAESVGLSYENGAARSLPEALALLPRRDPLERLIRCTARGSVSLEPLEEDANGDYI
jgi:hypothetical protein